MRRGYEERVRLAGQVWVGTRLILNELKRRDVRLGLTGGGWWRVGWSFDKIELEVNSSSSIK